MQFYSIQLVLVQHCLPAPGMYTFQLIMNRVDDDYDDYDNVCYCIDERPKLEGETENMGLCERERRERRVKEGSEGPRQTL